MSYLKPKCRICNCPTAEGGVPAAIVDKEKLKLWCSEGCGAALDGEVLDTDLICYFCVWQAESIHETEPVAESMIWWPTEMTWSPVAEEQRKHFLEGKIDQCWVQLVDVEGLIKGDSPKKPSRFFCFYCPRSYKQWRHLLVHCQEDHKGFITCPKRFCHAFFHTKEEMERHVDEVHELAKVVFCRRCNRAFSDKYDYASHYLAECCRTPSYVKCGVGHCRVTFQSEAKMLAHIAKEHNMYVGNKNSIIFQCSCCERGFKTPYELDAHLVNDHTPHAIECPKCEQRFATKVLLARHMGMAHANIECKYCDAEVHPRDINKHFNHQKCKYCGSSFECTVKFEEHTKELCSTLSIKSEPL